MDTLKIIDINSNLADKTTLRLLKAQRSRVLNKKCKSYNEFESAQESLNLIELNIKLLESKLY